MAVSGYTWGWIGFALYFAVLEITALRQSYVARRTGGADYRGTLSEHLWWLFGINRAGRGVERDATLGMKLRRVAAITAIGWFVVHMLSGGQYV